MAALASVLVGFLSALIAVVGLVASKESKISEFRQQWIDSLREDIAALIGIAVAMALTARRKSIDAIQLQTFSMQFSEAETRITLRFKKGDPDAIPLQKAVRGLVDIALRFESDESVHSQIVIVREEAQVILKEEWERVKRGEMNYFRTLQYLKFAIAGFFVLSPILLLAAIVAYLTQTTK